MFGPNSGAQASGQTLIKDGSDAGFMQDVIEASKTQPVIVDFWAPWCGPCKQLTPALEKSVKAAGGKVRLVKINIDQHPGVAGQLGVRSIPAVYAFDQGRPVDGFMGAVPESQVKIFIERLLGGAGGGGDDLEAILADAQASLEQGDIGGAAQGFAGALQIDPQNVKAIAGLARAYLASGDPERAKEALGLAPEASRNAAEIAGVRAALELAAEAKGAGDAARLAETIAADPDNHAARFDLAMAHVARGDLDGAVHHLLNILERDRAWNEEAARKQLVKIFDAAGPASAVTRAGRRRMSAILFS